jgi:hypothetical protein
LLFLRTRAVGAAQPVASAALEVQVGVVQQDLAAVRERELAVAQVLALLKRIDFIK